MTENDSVEQFIQLYRTATDEQKQLISAFMKGMELQKTLDKEDMGCGEVVRHGDNP